MLKLVDFRFKGSVLAVKLLHASFDCSSFLDQVGNAAMRGRATSENRILAHAAVKSNDWTVNLPVLHEECHRDEDLATTRTVFKQALVAPSAATLPVVLSHLVLELLRAGATIVFRVVQLLHDESIDVFA